MYSLNERALIDLCITDIFADYEYKKVAALIDQFIQYQKIDKCN